MSYAPSPETHPLLPKVERFLRQHGVGAVTFGMSVIGDPRFVYQLRKGREPRLQTVRFAEAQIAAFSETGRFIPRTRNPAKSHSKGRGKRKAKGRAA